MTSLSQQRKRIEKRKERTEGKKRKRALLAGTTPRFPIHIENDSGAVLPQPPGSNPDEN
jgi:hypothetical protein